MTVKKGRAKAAAAEIVAVVISASVFWSTGFIKTNRDRIRLGREIYPMGETVEIGNNFFVDKSENPEGYSVCVNRVELGNYYELYKKYGHEPDPEEFGDYPAPDTVYMLNLTVKNEGNTDGALFVLDYGLYNGALKLTVDYSLWGWMDEHYNNEYHLRLVPDSQANITIPFIPMPDDLSVGKAEVNRRINNESFLFEICDYPVRKYIEVHA